ncbi:hypothetical protein [Bradyrhizobium sp.]|uniref:hypothetical protein n=1 Tax=Bradyrhizobium sp. TaxID=376 RepID=UPI003C2332D2
MLDRASIRASHAARYECGAPSSALSVKKLMTGDQEVGQRDRFASKKDCLPNSRASSANTGRALGIEADIAASSGSSPMIRSPTTR